MTDNENYDIYEKWGYAILTTAVFAIIITAPVNFLFGLFFHNLLRIHSESILIIYNIFMFINILDWIIYYKLYWFEMA